MMNISINIASMAGQSRLGLCHGHRVFFRLLYEQVGTGRPRWII